MTLQVTALRLDRISLNVADVGAATAYYTRALGFELTSVCDADPVLAALLGARALRLALLRRGPQRLELVACDPAGAAYPPDSRSDDPWFQHCALATDDIGAAHARLSRFACRPISRHGPQLLPGGIIAFKFRDPDGHPLELIQFPQADPRTDGGIDHSAICVSDVERSITFYGAALGLKMHARQVNQGPAQQSLDDLDDVTVDVVSLVPGISAPHLELLGYRAAARRAAPAMRPTDIAASRLVFAAAAAASDAHTARLSDGTSVSLSHDPDGHALLVEYQP